MGFDIIKEQDILVNTTSGLMDLFARPEMLLSEGMSCNNIHSSLRYIEYNLIFDLEGTAGSFFFFCTFDTLHSRKNADRWFSFL